MKNEKFSHRNLSCKLNNKVVKIDGNKVIFWDSPLKGDYIDAGIKFTSGVAAGKEYRITANTLTSVDISSWGGTIPSPGDRFYAFWDLTVLSTSKFNNMIIVGSNLSKEIPDSVVAPDWTGVTLKDCQVNNCLMPPGTITQNCAELCIIEQNDKEDWECDKATKLPTWPVAYKAFIALGISTDPADIPETPLDESIITIKQREKFEATILEA